MIFKVEKMIDENITFHSQGFIFHCCSESTQLSYPTKKIAVIVIYLFHLFLSLCIGDNDSTYPHSVILEFQ